VTTIPQLPNYSKGNAPPWASAKLLLLGFLTRDYLTSFQCENGQFRFGKRAEFRMQEHSKSLDISTIFPYFDHIESHLPTECLLSIGGSWSVMYRHTLKK
jgi:hypothetical protein